MRVRFWGVRGSVPYATSGSIGFGCNTPCIEIVDEDSGRRLILDAGSGIVGVGAAMESIAGVSIVLTHYHWDHVQGLPFFAPFYRPRTDVTVWAPALGRQFADIETMFEAPFFPVPYDRLPSRPAIRMLTADDTTIDGFQMSVQPLNHPGGSFAYRITGADGDLVYATDHEFGNADIDAALTQFASGASAVILDSHFTPDEMPDRKGWGHGDWEQCARFARSCEARRLFLFHHKPGRTDDEMSTIERAARGIFVKTLAAKEGVTFIV
ncbi:MAG TPA: MBL fold metallo-hydrolase [Vicinamibacterales bacterium]|nr:MBL fold metallo-hydrolase [Vicinamibacterales bacterium]